MMRRSIGMLNAKQTKSIFNFLELSMKKILSPLMLAMACRHSAQRHPGRRVAAAHSDSYPTVRATQAAKCSPASRTLPLGGG